VAVAAEAEREIFIVSKMIQPTHRNIADTALSLDESRYDLDVDAPIEDIFMNLGRLK
jgi:hypothetical protein